MNLQFTIQTYKNLSTNNHKEIFCFSYASLSLLVRWIKRNDAYKQCGVGDDRVWCITLYQVYIDKDLKTKWKCKGSGRLKLVPDYS